jgi:hypothetical protein
MVEGKTMQDTYTDVGGRAKHDSREGGGRAKQDARAEEARAEDDRAEQKSARTSCTFVAPAHNPQGCGECRFCLEHKSVPAPAKYDRHGWRKCRFCRSKNLPVHPVHKNASKILALNTLYADRVYIENLIHIGYGFWTWVG